MRNCKKSNEKLCKKDNTSSTSRKCNCNRRSISCDYVNYSVETRIQFTVVESPENICNLLTMIGDEGINLDGHLIQAINCNCTLLSFTIGDENEQTSTSLAVVRCILKKLCMNFLEDDVLRVTPPTFGPGTFARLYCTLIADDIQIYNSYPSFSGDAIYIEPSCIRQAKCALNS